MSISISGRQPCWPAIARQAIEQAIGYGEAAADDPGPAENDCRCGGVFVTLHKFGRLRGCMGVLEPPADLIQTVRHAAVCAALQDPRFRPVAPGELGDIRIDVSIMTQPQPLRELDELELGRHGIIVGRGHSRGLFLPQVATEYGFSREEFLSRCCTEKAGLPPDAWRDPRTEVLIFTAEVFAEAD